MGTMTVGLVIAGIVVIAVVLLAMRWRSASSEQQALRHYQHALDTLRTVSDRMESSRPAVEPKSQLQAPDRDEVSAGAPIRGGRLGRQASALRERGFPPGRCPHRPKLAGELPRWSEERLVRVTLLFARAPVLLHHAWTRTRRRRPRRDSPGPSEARNRGCIPVRNRCSCSTKTPLVPSPRRPRTVRTRARRSRTRAFGRYSAAHGRLRGCRCF